MLKKIIVLALVILPLSAFAQKFGHLNSQLIVQAMPEYTKAQTDLQALEKTYSDELKKIQDEYQKKYSDYVQQQDSLTENIKLRRQQEIQDIQSRIDNFIQVAQQDVQKKQQELLQPIQTKIQTAIKSVGDEKGYTYIIDPAALLFTAPSAVNATAFVKTKLGLK